MLVNESDERRDVAQDTLTVIKGLHGTYPNFFFDIELHQVAAFAERYASIRHRQDYEKFVEIFGVRRTHPHFWEASDWFQDYYAQQQPVLSGLFDLNRYNNR